MRSIFDNWQTWAILSAIFAALTPIFGKVGVQRVDADFAPLRLAGQAAKLLPGTHRAQAFCGEIGVGVANPHSYVVKEGGMVKDIASIVAFKHETDPYGLLNPGKLDGTFYAAAVKR